MVDYNSTTEEIMHYVTNGSEPFLRSCKVTFSASYPHINSLIESVLSRAGKYKDLNSEDCNSLLKKIEEKYYYCFSRANYKYKNPDVLLVSKGRIFCYETIYFYIRNKKYIKELPYFIKSNIGAFIQSYALKTLKEEYEIPDAPYCKLEYFRRCDLCGKIITYEIKYSSLNTRFVCNDIYINRWSICRRKKCKKIASEVKKGNLIGNAALVKAIEKLTKGNKNARKENATH